MKRLFFAVLGVLIFTSCGTEESKVSDEPQHMQVYYLNASTNMLLAEEYDMPPKENIVNLISSTIELMMEDKGELKSVFPENTKLLDTRFEQGTASLEFSKEYLALEGFDKTTAECAIAMSLANFWNVDSIDIYVEGKLVATGLSNDNIVTEMPKVQE